MEGNAERVRELALGLHEVQPVVEKRHNPKILVKTGGSHGIMKGNFINAAKRWNAIFKVKIFPESYCPL